jgi:cation transport regulator
MPYQSNVDLPAFVHDHLQSHAQALYRAAFNHAYEAHAGDPRQEEIAHRIAWAAVKRSYTKVGDVWMRRDCSLEQRSASQSIDRMGVSAVGVECDHGSNVGRADTLRLEGTWNGHRISVSAAP